MLMRTIGLRVPAIRRLWDSRNALLAERAVVTIPREADPEAEALRRARAEGRLIVTEYPYHPRRRPIEESAGGQRLVARLRSEQDGYAATLHGIARHVDALLRVPRNAVRPGQPFWANDWFPPLDCASVYGLIAERAPRRYVEVGSGISTRFAHQAIQDLGLRTRIVSIDPHPHTDIDGLCDEAIRSRLEDIPRDFWETIGPDDLLFVDSSHRSFANSDVTVFFTEVLPALPTETVWGLHDIMLPGDYPDAWRDRFFNEQYLLLAYLLGGGSADILLPAAWVSSQPQLHGILAPLWARDDLLHGAGTHGVSFWMRHR